MRQTILQLALSLALTSASLLPAQDAKPVDGTWSMGGKPYKLLHVIAHETEVFGKPGIAVLASDRPFNLDAIKKSLADKKGNADVSSRQPYLKVVFERTGKIKSYYATASGFTTNGSGNALSGDLKIDGDRVSGKAKLESQGDGDLQRSFEFQFATGLLGTASEPTQQVVPLAKLGVSGTFKGNRKDSRIAFVSARRGEPFADKPSVVLVFTERDHSRDPRPDIKAGFGDYGSALVISCHEDGNIFGCEVSHAAHPKRGFSSSGKIDMKEFQIAGGQVQGQLSTGGETTAFDQTWEVELKFAAPFAGAAQTPAPPSPNNSAATNRNANSAKPKTEQPAAKAAAGQAAPATKLNVKDLAILQGANDVEFKALVEHIGFHSSTDYKTLAAELAKKLDAQGWKKDGSDLIGVSAILKRKLGAASLTIFVKPDGAGSRVTVMTEGLSWDR